MSINQPPMCQGTENFILPMIYNKETLNLFSDASMRPVGKNILAACYGSVAVCEDRVVDQMYKMQSLSTVPAAEIRGIRMSLDLALKHRQFFRVINIFSDSMLALCSLRDHMSKWRFDENTGRYRNSVGTEVQNQELFTECYMMLDELRKTNVVNLFHQRGHIDNDLHDIRKACQSFKMYNGINGEISYDVIRYISTYNNFVDNTSRSMIKRTNVFENNYEDALSFTPRGDIQFF